MTAFAVGACGIAAELSASVVLAEWLGFQVTTSLAVLSAFFIGSGLGVSVLPARLTVPACVVGALTALALGPVSRAFDPPRIGGDPAVEAFLIALLVMIPLALGVGAALARVFERGATGARYTADLLGGTLAAALVVAGIIPVVGSQGAMLFVAVLLFLLAWSIRGARDPRATEQRNAQATTRYALFVSGALSVAVESTLFALVADHLMSTLFTFAVMLVSYLGVGALGASVARRVHAPRGLAVAGGLGTSAALALAGASSLLLPPDSGPSLLRELAFCALVFGPPAFASGALFPALLDGATDRRRALSFNAFGASLGPPLAAGSIAVAGFHGAVSAYVLGYLALAFLMLDDSARDAEGTSSLTSKPPRAWMLAALSFFALALLPLGGNGVPLADAQERVTKKRESLEGTVAVIAGPDPVQRRLRMGRYFAGGGTGYVERRLGHLSAMFEVDARSALVIGVGTGGTLAGVTAHVEDVDAVEISRDVLAMLPHFEYLNAGSDRARLHVADARRFAADQVSRGARYDLITTDLVHPGRRGAEGLFTAEHFETLRRLLSEGGCVVVWLPLYQLGAEQLATITETFLSVFPEASGALGHYGARMPVLGLISGGATLPATEEEGARVFGGGAGEFVMGGADLLSARSFDVDALTSLASQGRGVHRRSAPTLTLSAAWSAYGIRRSSVEAVLALTSRPLSVPQGGEAQVGRFHAAAMRYLAADQKAQVQGEDEEVANAMLESLATHPGFAPARGYLLRMMSEHPWIGARVLAIDPNDTRFVAR